MNLLVRLIVAMTLALTATFALLTATHPIQATSASLSPDEDSFVFLPIIYGPISPAGSYFCSEYEFGLVWTTEVITLNPDHSSRYAYNPPYTAIVTGTWAYTPVIQEVGFTNFRWLTTTFQSPDRLWASQYLTHAGFEIAVSCNRLE